MWVKRRRGWEIAESRVTDESVYLNRRQFVRASTGLCASAALGLLDCRSAPRPETTTHHHRLDPGPKPGTDPIEYGIEKLSKPSGFHVGKPNPKFAAVPDGRTETSYEKAASYNNYYEFTTAKPSVWKKVGAFHTRPWTVEVGGMVQRPKTYDVDELMRKMPSEERIYRHRCVEAWSMVVPWTGFPLRALLDEVQPLGSAKYVRFVTAQRPKQMPGMAHSGWYPWPYHEALRIDEASNELALLVTGLYGKLLPRQNGAPLRLIVPWKYGYKSIKAIVKIELVAEQPTTFWNSIAPKEYGFLSNVDPSVPHPRWSQATERDIQTNERIPTLPYNGYGDWVASMYSAPTP